MNLFAKLKTIYRDSSLAAKIRYSYVIILVPMMTLVVISLVNIYLGNQRYHSMIDSAVVASGFSLDFKDDFDYQTYLVVVENQTLEESDLAELLQDANRIVDELTLLTEDGVNLDRLESAKKYLSNLQNYMDHIRENLQRGDMYEENMMIWENDVQIVTALIQDTLNEFIFFEIRDLQEERSKLERTEFAIIDTMVVAALVLLIIMLVFSYSIPETIAEPIRQISEVTHQVAEGNLSVRTDIRHGVEVKDLGESLNRMIDKIEGLLEQVTLEQIRLRHAELELLQAQINPHFLYNTLDTIIWLAEWGEQEKVVSMVTSLSRFFRTSLSEGKDTITLGEELQHAGSYLEIQQVRYQDILTFSIDVPEELLACQIPKITIQPLVENALYHGIKNKRRQGCIKVGGYKEGETCYITVSDDGIGISPERLEQIRARIKSPQPDADEIFGLYNVNERIRLHMGDDYGISIESENGEGTTVIIRLPVS